MANDAALAMARRTLNQIILDLPLIIVVVYLTINSSWSRVAAQVSYTSPPPPSVCPSCLPPPTTYCPPPPSPPLPTFPPPPGPIYYYSPPPPFPYPPYWPYVPPPPYYSPPPPNPILPYFPFYFKNPPPPPDFSSAHCLSVVPSLTWVVLIITILPYLHLLSVFSTVQYY